MYFYPNQNGYKKVFHTIVTKVHVPVCEMCKLRCKPMTRSELLTAGYDLHVYRFKQDYDSSFVGHAWWFI